MVAVKTILIPEHQLFLISADLVCAGPTTITMSATAKAASFDEEAQNQWASYLYNVYLAAFLAPEI
jgi:hypothetical protein